MHGTYRGWEYDANRGTLLCAYLVYKWAHRYNDGVTDQLTCLVEKGATLNPTPGWEGPIPLFLAVSCNEPSVLQYLMNKGMDIHYCGTFRGRYGNALDHSIKHGWNSSAQFLRDNGLTPTALSRCNIM